MPVTTTALGVFLGVVGASHGVVPGYYERLVPPWVPHHRAVVLASGAVEVGLGVALLVPATRTAAAGATVVLFTGYVLTHVDALVRSRRPGGGATWLDRTPGAVGRVAVNVAYVAWAVAAVRATGGG